MPSLGFLSYVLDPSLNLCGKDRGSIKEPPNQVIRINILLWKSTLLRLKLTDYRILLQVWSGDNETLFQSGRAKVGPSKMSTLSMYNTLHLKDLNEC
jgi:hypothetical protein